MFLAEDCPVPRYLISYDAATDRVRARLASRLEKAGTRVQKSVFILSCAEKAYENLVRDLLSILDDEDSLLCVPICRHCYSNSTTTGKMAPVMAFL